ncbi:hypothetical protein BJV82DRAFT_26245 [Fennellomyces sp. T-0311]|nr:hypothetical protein BJV82DRAFT_26245 [Fennellomyces sp. T-0311]
MAFDPFALWHTLLLLVCSTRRSSGNASGIRGRRTATDATTSWKSAKAFYRYQVNSLEQGHNKYLSCIDKRRSQVSGTSSSVRETSDWMRPKVLWNSESLVPGHGLQWNISRNFLWAKSIVEITKANGKHQKSVSFKSTQ